MADYADARRKMVDCQLRTNDVTDHELLKAMGAVPRESFVPASRAALAYIDDDLPVESSDGRRFLMRPATFGKLVQLAEIGPDDVVLLIGGASGYEAAVLARLAGSVVMLECDPDLARTAASTVRQRCAAAELALRNTSCRPMSGSVVSCRMNTACIPRR